MTQEFLRWLIGLVKAGDVHPFYVTGEWRRLSAEVLRQDKGECQLCKARGRYRRADLVHHVNHVRRRPELALDMWYADQDGAKRKNLVSVCRECHETICHPERMRRGNRQSGYRNAERWD